jgi:hypothetical protein
MVRKIENPGLPTSVGVSIVGGSTYDVRTICIWEYSAMVSPTVYCHTILELYFRVIGSPGVQEATRNTCLRTCFLFFRFPREKQLYLVLLCQAIYITH